MLHNGCDQSCTDAQYQEPKGHQGWDPSASSKWKARLKEVLLDLIINKKSGRKKLTLRDRQGGRPLVSQDVQANRAVGIDVWVINLGREADLGGLEWIIGGERDGEEENASGIRGITLGHTAGQDESLSPTGYELTGPIIVACHWNILSPVGPALHDEGGSRPRSINSCRATINLLSIGRLGGHWG